MLHCTAGVGRLSCAALSCQAGPRLPEGPPTLGSMRRGHGHGRGRATVELACHPQSSCILHMCGGMRAPTELLRCRPHSRDALRHTRPMEASLRPRGQSGERSAAACGSPSSPGARDRAVTGAGSPCGGAATEPPAATSNQGPSAKTATGTQPACLGSGSIRYRQVVSDQEEVSTWRLCKKKNPRRLRVGEYCGCIVFNKVIRIGVS